MNNFTYNAIANAAHSAVKKYDADTLSLDIKVARVPDKNDRDGYKRSRMVITMRPRLREPENPMRRGHRHYALPFLTINADLQKLGRKLVFSFAVHKLGTLHFFCQGADRVRV